MNGMRSGNGNLSFANGDVYEGSFDKDMIHGEGRMTYYDGGYYDGQWFSN